MSSTMDNETSTPPQGGESNEIVKLFVGQVPEHIGEEELRAYFVKFGDVLEVNMIRDRSTGAAKGKRG